MEVPECLLGSSRDVMRHARRIWRGVASGKELAPGPFVDTKSVPEAFLLLEQDRARTGERHFRLYAPLQAGAEDVPRKQEALLRLFDTMLKSPWGALGLLNEATGFLKIDDARASALLAAIARHWPTYTAVGPRFSPYLVGQELWESSVALKYYVIRQGVPQSQVPAKLPGGDLRAYLRADPERFRAVLAALDGSGRATT